MKFIISTLLALGVGSMALSSSGQAIPSDPKIEKAVQKQLSSMTLDQKLGQMIQVESNLVALTRSEYGIESLFRKSKDEVASLIEKFGLTDKYDASKLFSADGRPNISEGYSFYTLSQDINSALGFEFDPEKLKMAFGEYKVGSILNMLGGHATDLPTWQRAISDIQDAASKHLGIPCLYGLDQVHGTTYSLGGTIFPQPIGMSATFNPDLVHHIGEISAYETRACGVPWVFVPDLDLGRTPAWSRQYEGVGEDPYLGAVIGTAYMLGFQGDDPNHIDQYHVATCLKHFTGYGVTANGRDRVPGQVSEMELREKYFAPFLSAFRAGSLSTMTNSSILNGMNGVANKKLLTGWLKEELDWDGMIVTDWADIENLRKRDHIAATQKDGIIMAINAGVDLMMVPSEWGYGKLLKEAVEEGSIPMSRIDDAVARILRLKHRVGLYENAKPDAKAYPDFGSPKHAAVALKAALESEVLLKNEDNTLPIAKGKKILATGPNANTMRGLNGGWTYTWQGSGTEEYSKSYHTILDALRAKFGEDNVIYAPGLTYDDKSNDCEAENAPDIQGAVSAAKDADIILACIGENSYAETTGNISNLHLSGNQTELVRQLAATGKPIVLILNQGRCRLIYDIEPLAKAVVDVMLPGNYGGDALAELLSGEENFSGRLPFTYPSYPQTFTTYDYKVCEVQETMAGIYNYEAKTNAQWWFGHGLSYTSFEYKNLRVSRESFTKDDEIAVTVDVTNTGSRSGKEVVMLYSSDMVASIIPDNKRLRAFEKVELNPGETKTVSLTLKGSDLAFVGGDSHWVLEKGEFKLSVGGLSKSVSCTDTYHWESPNI